MIASGSVYNMQDEGLFMGRINYNGPEIPSSITLNGVLEHAWYGHTSLYITIRCQGEAPFLSSVVDAGNGTPSSSFNLSNYSVPFTLPATGGIEKTIEVRIYWGAGVGEGYGGDSGYMNVSGTFTNP